MHSWEQKHIVDSSSNNNKMTFSEANILLWFAASFLIFFSVSQVINSGLNSQEIRIQFHVNLLQKAKQKTQYPANFWKDYGFGA